MPIPIATSPATHSLLDKPICFPLKLVLTPFLFVIKKVVQVFKNFIGYFVRIGVFSFGEWNHSFIKKKIIDFYNEGIWGFFYSNRFSFSRLKEAFNVLTNVGGIRAPLYTKNGNRLDSMLLRYTNVKKTIEEQGGKIVQCFPINDVKQTREGKEVLTQCKENRSCQKEYVDIIFPDAGGEKWNNFCKSTLSKLGLEKAEVEMRDGKVVNGFIIKHWDRRRPTRPKTGQCFVRCNSPTESYPMAKRDIMRRVLLGLDVLCFDPPGTGESQGTPTEADYYLAVEAAVEKAAKDYGYSWKDLWVDGFCLGGAVAARAKYKYHDEGINLLLQNSFDKLGSTLDSQVFPASHIAHLGLDSVKSSDPLASSLVKQDGFDTVHKLESLCGKKKKGTTIIVNTDTDSTIHKNSQSRLAPLLEQVSKATYSILYQHPDKKSNGHRADVFSDDDTYNKVVRCITAKDYPGVFDDRSWWDYVPFIH